MKPIRVFLFALLALCAVSAHAATLLPLAEQTFLDNNGAPLAGGRVFFYIPNTSTPKATYQNSGGTVSNSNPVTLDGSGRAIIYGAGQYRQQVYDANGNLIWDQLTADTSGGASYSWAGISAGTANAQTLSAPNFTLGDGQEIGFIAGLSNTGALTVVVNNGSPIGVVKATATGPSSLTTGDVIAGNQYFLSYSATNGNFQINTLPQQAILPSSPIIATVTTDLGTIASHNAVIVGSNPISSFGSSASVTSQFYFVTFSNSPLIVESASILTPNGSNIQAEAGDSAFLVYLGGGAWQIISFAPSALPVQTPSGRLTLSSATPVLSSPVLGALTIYYTPYQGVHLPVWNGAVWQPGAFSERSELLSESTFSPAAAVANSLYDLFVWTVPASTSQILSRGPAWTNPTTRALALSNVNGVLTNASAITNGPAAGYGVYVGTIATDPGAATVSFNPAPAAASGGPATSPWVGLWNEYNRVLIGVQAQDSNASWTYASSTWGALDGSTTNRITLVSGEAEDSVHFSGQVAAVGASGFFADFGVGLNSTTAALVSAGIPNQTLSMSVGGNIPGQIGQFYLQALQAATSGTSTFYGLDATISTTGQLESLAAEARY
jgi:hypothetical protein